MTDDVKLWYYRWRQIQTALAKLPEWAIILVLDDWNRALEERMKTLEIIQQTLSFTTYVIDQDTCNECTKQSTCPEVAAMRQFCPTGKRETLFSWPTTPQPSTTPSTAAP